MIHASCRFPGPVARHVLGSHGGARSWASDSPARTTPQIQPAGAQTFHHACIPPVLNVLSASGDVAQLSSAPHMFFTDHAPEVQSVSRHADTEHYGMARNRHPVFASFSKTPRHTIPAAMATIVDDPSCCGQAVHVCMVSVQQNPRLTTVLCQ